MNTLVSIVERLRTDGLLSLPRRQLDSLRAGLDELFAEDTHFAGLIHLLRLPEDAGFAVAETPDPDTAVLRHFQTEDEARRFIDERLETYERMWDGCGCKIDYFERP